jgi:L-lactate dehydrogenase complex protein LldG
MSSQQSKENILQKIRQALATPTEKVVPKPDFSTSIYTSTQEETSVLFAETFIKTKGDFIYCEDDQQFIDKLSVLLVKKNIHELYAWESPLKKLLQENSVSFKSDDTKFLGAEAGLTLCECLIARTGSIVVSSKQVAGRRLGIYPPVHIVVAYTSQLVTDIIDALKFMENKYGQKMPSMINMITGPSRTADIEKTLVLGAHGPRELLLFLIED